MEKSCKTCGHCNYYLAVRNYNERFCLYIQDIAPEWNVYRDYCCKWVETEKGGEVMKNNVFDMIERGENFKIRVTPEQSRKFQKAAFEAGIDWGVVNPKVVYFPEMPYLFVRQKRITFDECENYFKKSDLPEAFFPEDAKKLNEDIIKESSKRFCLYIQDIAPEWNVYRDYCCKWVEAEKGGE